MLSCFWIASMQSEKSQKNNKKETNRFFFRLHVSSMRFIAITLTNITLDATTKNQ